MRSMSLRSRLLLVTVSLVALGLVAASAATYALLRSNLIGRVDEQLRAARRQATQALFQGDRGFPRGPGEPRLPGARELPVTYAVLLDRSGDVVATRSFGFGSTQSPPALPAAWPGSSTYDGNEPSIIFTSGSEDGSLRYRVLAQGFQNGTVAVAYPLADVDETLRGLLVVEGLVSVLVLGAAAGLALWLVRLGFKPLVQMEHAAADIAAGDLSRRVEHAGENTEIGRLGRALNAMLEKIEAAFSERRASEERLRRFVADASHELRTPLTSIRGYAELFRHGASARPEDLATSMRRIEEESARMGQLVEELLLLARLDQGRPLDLVPVDLATIARDAVEDARVIQPERPIDFLDEGPLPIHGDEARLRQVAANLLSNALVHTPVATPVHVRVMRRGADAVLEVADEGPGLSADDASKVFDRFFRVDVARTHEKANAGLGLSIVTAIVQAHGGTVALDAAPGRGATFVVRLPRDGATPAEPHVDSQQPRRIS